MYRCAAESDRGVGTQAVPGHGTTCRDEPEHELRNDRQKLTYTKTDTITEDVVLRPVKLADGRVVDDVLEAMEIVNGGVTIWTKYRVWVIRSDAFMERLIFLPRNPPDSED